MLYSYLEWSIFIEIKGFQKRIEVILQPFLTLLLHGLVLQSVNIFNNYWINHNVSFYEYVS